MASTANSHARSDAAATGPIEAIGFRDMAARWALAVVVIGAAANLLVQGFEFPAYNNMYHVPIVLNYAHTVEGPHDAFDQSLTNFTSLLWPLLSLVATERNVEALFFAVYALNRVALLVFLYLTAREMLPGRRAAPALALALSVAVLLWWMAWPLSPLGGNDLFVRALSQTQLTVTALVACLWLMLRRRWLATAICLGIAFDVNAFMALWGGLIALVAYIYVHRTASRPALLRNLARLGAAAAVAALPTIVWIAWTVKSALPAATFDYRQYIREFYPRHNLLEGNWSGVLIAAMVATVVWSYIRDQRLFASARQREIVAASFTALCGIVLFGMAMPYLVDSRLLYCLFPLRMDGYLIAPLMMVLISVALARAHAAADDGSFWSEALVLFAFANGNLPLALVAAQARPGARDGRRVAALLLLLAAALVAISAEVPVYYRPGGMKALALVMCQAVVAVIALRAQRSRPAQAVVIAALIAPALAPAALATSLRIAIALVYFGAAIALAGLTEPGRPREIARPATGAWPAAMLRAWAAPVILMAALAGGALRVAAAGTINNLAPADRAEFEAQLWLRGHSPPDARVLPFDAEGFSVLSRRPVWVDSKVGSAVMWAPWYFSTWQTRLNEVSRLHDLRQTLDYAHAHDIAYIVMSRAAAARLGAGPATPGIVYTNPDYLILATDRTAPPAASAGRPRSP